MGAGLARALRIAVRAVGAIMLVTMAVGLLDAGGAIAYAAFVPVRTGSAERVTGRRAPVLVVFGDSLAYGFRATPGHGWVDEFRRRLQRRAPGSVVLNAAVCGARVADVKNEVERGPRVAASSVFVVAGGNDVLSGIDPLRFAYDERALLARLRERYPRANVVMTNVPDVSWRTFRLRPGEAAKRLPPAVRAWLSVLADIDDATLERLTGRSGVAVIDLHHLVPSDVFDTRYISDDGLHPNDLGYAALANYAWPAIARATNVVP